jgi:type II secretory pathway pseudopilin PulG
MTNDTRGYSALEMLISLLVTSLLLAALYTVLFQSQANFESQQDSMFLRQAARVALDRMASDLRVAGLGIDNLPEAIVEARENRLVFVADSDDGSSELPCGAAFETSTDGGAERFTYDLEGDTLLLSVDCWNGKSWAAEYTDQIVARNVVGTEPLFRYFDAEDNELIPEATEGLNAAEREAVRTVGLSIVLADPSHQALGRPTVDFHLRTQVRLRNVGIE